MSNSDWYARKLGRQAPSAPAPPPAYAPPPGWVPPNQAQQQHPGYQQPLEQQMPVEEEYRPKGAKHLRSSDLGGCPNCDSPNYIKATPNTAVRCYDCGYPIEQSGSDSPSMSGMDLPVNQARQVDTSGTWNPGGFAKGVGIINKPGWDGLRE